MTAGCILTGVVVSNKVEEVVRSSGCSDAASTSIVSTTSTSGVARDSGAVDDLQEQSPASKRLKVTETS